MEKVMKLLVLILIHQALLLSPVLAASNRVNIDCGSNYASNRQRNFEFPVAAFIKEKRYEEIVYRATLISKANEFFERVKLGFLYFSEADKEVLVVVNFTKAFFDIYNSKELCFQNRETFGYQPGVNDVEIEDIDDSFSRLKNMTYSSGDRKLSDEFLKNRNATIDLLVHGKNYKTVIYPSNIIAYENFKPYMKDNKFLYEKCRINLNYGQDDSETLKARNKIRVNKIMDLWDCNQVVPVFEMNSTEIDY